jgi:hypothetical protein
VSWVLVNRHGISSCEKNHHISISQTGWQVLCVLPGPPFTPNKTAPLGDLEHSRPFWKPHTGCWSTGTKLGKKFAQSMQSSTAGCSLGIVTLHRLQQFQQKWTHLVKTICFIELFQ